MAALIGTLALGINPPASPSSLQVGTFFSYMRRRHTNFISLRSRRPCSRTSRGFSVPARPLPNSFLFFSFLYLNSRGVVTPLLPQNISFSSSFEPGHMVVRQLYLRSYSDRSQKKKYIYIRTLLTLGMASVPTLVPSVMLRIDTLPGFPDALGAHLCYPHSCLTQVARTIG